MSCLFYSCEGVFEPLDTAGYLAVANVVYHDRELLRKNDGPLIVVVGIDEKRYADRYDRITPLPRCKLRDDLQMIFGKNPRLVAIDLDLSPTIWKQHNALDPSSKCEEEITHRLEALDIPVVLILPRALPNTLEQYAREKHKWMRRLCEKEHITFAEPFLPVSWGAVTEYYNSPSNVGVVVDTIRKNKFLFPGKPCQRVLALPESQKAYGGNGYLSGEWGDVAIDEPIKRDLIRRIHFSRFREHVSQFRWGEIETLPDLTDKVVLFGARYGHEDLHVTPLGEMHGVDIHGAAAASEWDPMHEFDLMDIFLDVVLGMIFGVVVRFFWVRYFDTSIRDNPVAYGWLVCFVFVYALLAIGASWIAFFLLGLGVWLSPISMAIGMFVDGFVVGGVAHAREKLAQSEDYSYQVQGVHPLQFEVGVGPISRHWIRLFLVKLPYMVAIGTITYAILKATVRTFRELASLDNFVGELLRRLIV